MSWQTNPPNEVEIFTSSNSLSDIPATPYVKALLFGGKWGDKNPNNGEVTDLLYWYFPEGTQYHSLTGNFETYSWLQYEKVAINNAMSAFSDVAISLFFP